MKHKMLCLGVAPPLRSGNMQYHMVGMRIELSQVLSSDKVPEAAWQTAKASGKTRPVDFEKEEVPTYEAVACLIKELSGQNVFKPTERFKASGGIPVAV